MAPATVQSIYANNIVSNLDIHKPEELNILFRRRGDQGLGYFRLLESFGFKTPVAQETYGHWEEEWLTETFITRDTFFSPGPGGIVTITLDPASLDADNNFYPRVWDTVMFPNEVTGAIIAIDTVIPTAPALTIQPNQWTDEIPGMTAGDELIIISNAWSEGSGQPPGLLSKVWRYTNDVQIVKDTMEATGTEMTNQTWFTQINTGEAIPAYYLKGQLDTDYRVEMKIDGTLFFQKRTTSPIVDPATNRNIRTTEGLIPYARRVGNEQGYVPGTFAVADFDTASRTLDREFASNNVLCMLGFDLDVEIENVLVTYFTDTNVKFVKENAAQDLFAGNRKLEASVSFKYLQKASRTFMFKRMGVFSHAKLYGATGYNGPDLGVLLPIGRKKDLKTNKMMPTIGCRYKKLGPYNRMMEVWDVNGAGPGLKVTANDVSQHFMRCNIGAHYMAGNQIVLLTP